jgi:hypothetical protein
MANIFMINEEVARGMACPFSSINLFFYFISSNAVLIRINAPRVKMTAPLGKLMAAYQDQTGAPADTLRFYYYDRRIAKDDTPMKLKMKQVSFI